MKTKKIVLNVGLNNNTKRPDEIVEMFQARLSDRATWAIVTSTYNNEVEPTLVLHGETAQAFKTIVDKVKQLSAELTQECIAAQVDDHGVLVYDQAYKGERYKFDQKYFRKIIG